MEEKRIEIRSSVWSIFNFRHSFKFFPTRPDKDNSKTSVYVKTFGFTLVEILVAVAIIGVMATILIAIINPATQLKKSRDADRKADLKVIQSTLEAYRSDCGSYPAALASPFVLTTALCSAYTGTTITYIQSQPTDPKTNGNYYYCVGNGASCGSNSTTGYAIWSCLENSAETTDNVSVFAAQPIGSPSLGCPSSSKFYKVTNP